MLALRSESPPSWVCSMSRIVKRSTSQAVKSDPSGRSRRDSPLPRFIPPQLSQPVEKPPSGAQWLHEVKLDGYRMAARIDNGRVQLLTRTGLDWTAKYPSAIAALETLNVKAAYLDDELCGVDDAGLPSFAQTQAATDGERDVHLVYYAFDLLHIGGWDVSGLSLVERKALLEPFVSNKPGLQFNGHDTGDGELILKHAGKLGFEGVVSKTIDAPYAPGNRGLWRKAKALNRQEFVVVGWSDPEGPRPHLGALLLGYYADDGKLIYAGRVGTGMPVKVLADLRRRLDPLARRTRFGSAASCRILCRPSTMSCRAAIIAITPARSPFTMEARGVLARSSLPLMRHPSILRTLEELAAPSTIRAAAKLSSVAVNVSTNNLPMLCCTSRPSFSAVPIPLTHSASGSNSAGPCFTSSALTFSFDHSSSCAAARLGLVRGSIVAAPVVPAVGEALPARAIERVDERVDGPRASSRMRSIVQAEKAHPTIRRDQASRTTAR
jgi:DNA ligase D-like protein (predicted ligase)